MFSRGKTVLVVDDSRTVLMVTSVLLHRMGFEVFVVQSSEDAIPLAKMHHPDVILLDVFLSGKDGMTVLEELKTMEETSQVPVIMFSVRFDSDIVNKCKSLGCSGYLTRPMSVTDLHNALEEVITKEVDNRRKVPRITFEKRVAITVDEKKKVYPSVNLSEGGLFVRCLDPLPTETIVHVTIPLDDGRSVSAEGKVIYTKDILFGGEMTLMPGMAITFTKISDENQNILTDLIHHLLAGDLIEEKDSPIAE